MRLIALSIIVLAGAIMASAGAIADSLPNARRYSDLNIWGLLLIGVAAALFAVEWWTGWQRRDSVHRDMAVAPSVA